MTNSAAAAPASSTSQSLLLRELPTTLPTVEYWRIHDEPLPRDIDEKVLIERYGFNDDAEDDWIQPPDYIRYAAPLEHQLLRQTEYTMDESDALWMDDFNADRVQGGRSQLQPLPYEYFEVVMDTIEKEWFALQARIPKVEEWTSAEDSQCAVCGDGECENSNAIVFCDGCNLAVHQDCYGVPYIPEGQWLCRKCTVSPDKPVACCLCPNEFGAFKQTTNGKWGHLLCAIWVNETGVSNTVYMEPIDGVDLVPKSRWKLVCYLCKQRMGACIQCSKSSCYTAYHATCAREAGCHMKMGTSSGATHSGEAVNVSYCLRHSAPFRDGSAGTDDIRNMSEELPMPDNDHGHQSKRRKLQAYSAFHDSGRNSSSMSPEPDSAVPLINPSVKQSRAYNKSFRSVGPPIIPQYCFDNIWNHVKYLKVNNLKKFVTTVCRYWSLKREHRRGAPLLKRLHLEPWTAATISRQETDTDKEKKLKLVLALRADLAEVREAVDLVRQREREKLRKAQLVKSVIESTFFPQTAVFRTALAKIQAFDQRDLFLSPVSAAEVPDYHEVVKNPMDWQTISQKIERNEYLTAWDFISDVQLVISNALLYNKADTSHGKAAIRVRDGSAAIFKDLDAMDDTEGQLHALFDAMPSLLQGQSLRDLLDTWYPSDAGTNLGKRKRTDEADTTGMPAQSQSPERGASADQVVKTGTELILDMLPSLHPSVTTTDLLDQSLDPSYLIKRLRDRAAEAKRRDAKVRQAQRSKAHADRQKAKKLAAKNALLSNQPKTELEDPYVAIQSERSTRASLSRSPTRASPSRALAAQQPDHPQSAVVEPTLAPVAEVVPPIHADVNPHDSFLLFNSGWVLPDGSKRARSVTSQSGRSARSNMQSVSPKLQSTSLPAASTSVLGPAITSATADADDTVDLISGSDLTDVEDSEEEVYAALARRSPERSDAKTTAVTVPAVADPQVPVPVTKLARQPSMDSISEMSELSMLDDDEPVTLDAKAEEASSAAQEAHPANAPSAAATPNKTSKPASPGHRRPTTPEPLEAVKRSPKSASRKNHSLGLLSSPQGIAVPARTRGMRAAEAALLDPACQHILLDDDVQMVARPASTAEPPATAKRDTPSRSKAEVALDAPPIVVQSSTENDAVAEPASDSFIPYARRPRSARGPSRGANEDSNASFTVTETRSPRRPAVGESKASIKRANASTGSGDDNSASASTSTRKARRDAAMPVAPVASPSQPDAAVIPKLARQPEVSDTPMAARQQDLPISAAPTSTAKKGQWPIGNPFYAAQSAKHAAALEAINEKIVPLLVTNISELENEEVVWAQFASGPVYPAEVVIDYKGHKVPREVINSKPNDPPRPNQFVPPESLLKERNLKTFRDAWVLIQWHPRTLDSIPRYSWMSISKMAKCGDDLEFDRLMQTKEVLGSRAKSQNAVKKAYASAKLCMETEAEREAADNEEDDDDEEEEDESDDEEVEVVQIRKRGNKRTSKLDDEPETPPRSVTKEDRAARYSARRDKQQQVSPVKGEQSQRQQAIELSDSDLSDVA